MKRLIIIVEGQTEQEFVKSILAPYFREKEIYSVTAVPIHKRGGGRGGLSNYDHLKKDIMKFLQSEKDIIVTTFVDFFRIPTNMPGYADCMIEGVPHADQVNCLEKSFRQAINDERFVPYIQLHEFEALLFSSNKGFEYFYDDTIYNKTKEIVDSFANPEDINSSPQTAPSKRLLSIKPDYDKVIEGNLIAIEVGINSILEKCPRFKAWVKKLCEVVEK